MTYNFTVREKATILAALRLWQKIDNPSSRRFYANNFDFPMLDDIATNGDRYDALDNNEIDILIDDKINIADEIDDDDTSAPVYSAFAAEYNRQIKLLKQSEVKA